MPNAMQRVAVNEADTIVYPPGCRDVTQDLGADELIRRLKTLAHTFQSMGQDDGTYQEYIPLSLHLSDNYFLSHQSKDVQLLIACCIADVLRVYAPEAPYKEPDKVKRIFLFLIRQLSGLRDPKDPAFKRYFYLLENLAYVKSFNMCFELEDSQEIFCNLFSLMFKIVNDEHSPRVRSFMLDVMCPLITESDVVSTQLLDIILINLVDPTKKTRKQAYKLAEELVLKTSDTLEPYIQNFFNQTLILGNEEKRLNISKKVYDLIDELNKICPNVLLAVLPQLEFKLKSTESIERMGVVTLLAGMFSEEGSSLAIQHRGLWLAFLGRFNDISVHIRTTCVQHSMHFLLNHPELRSEIIQTLKMRQHDSEEAVRLEVVKAIVSTAKKNFSIVADSEELLNFVKERTLDKKYKIRREAMTGLAFIYKEHQNDPDVPEATKNAVTWIKDKILHGYYMPGLDDRLLVERLMNMYLVPYKLPPEERMKKLYYIFATIDENATKAFIELQKHQMTVRKSVTELLETYSKQLPQEERDKELVSRVTFLSKFLPESVKAMEFLKKFALQLALDPKVLGLMKNVVDPKVSCKECMEAVNQLLKKAGPPVKTNLYYSTVKMLMERVSSVMVDREALQILIHYVVSCVKGDSETNISYAIGIEPSSAGEKGLRLLYVLSFVFPSHFLHDDILSELISLLQLPEDSVQPLVLSILTIVGKHCPIGDVVPSIMDVLIPLCKRFAQTGTAKQAKHAIRCLCSNVVREVDQDRIYPSLLESLKDSLSMSNPHFRTALVSLGHIAYQHPEKFPVQMKNIVSRKVVKELLMKDQTTTTLSDSEEWVEEDELPEETRCKIEGMKLMARWLLGLKNDNISAQKTFRMLSAFILHKGDLLEEGKVSRSEKAWLRLCAATCMLRICEQKGVGDQFTAEQFYTLSSLMMDESGYVRERFAAKLHKGLSRGIPHRCLPLDFMGLYALGGHEPDRARKAAIKSYMMSDINKRRDYVKGLLLPGASEKASEQLPHILPDYMLVFAVPILAHDPEYTSYENEDYLTKIRSCLWFILEPLITKNENYCFGFYKELVEKMKQHKDAVNPEDDGINYKIWAVSDLAMGLILQKTVTFDMKDSMSSARIPPMYFRKADEPDWVNTRCYLPKHLQYVQKKAVAGTPPPSRIKTNQVAVGNLERVPTRVPREETDEDEDDEPSRKRSRISEGKEKKNTARRRTKKQNSESSIPNSQAKENMPPKSRKRKKSINEEILSTKVKKVPQPKKGRGARGTKNLITNYLSSIPKDADSPKRSKWKAVAVPDSLPTEVKSQRRPARGRRKNVQEELVPEITSTSKTPRKRKTAASPEKSVQDSSAVSIRTSRKAKQSPVKKKESVVGSPKSPRTQKQSPVKTKESVVGSPRTQKQSPTKDEETSASTPKEPTQSPAKDEESLAGTSKRPRLQKQSPAKDEEVLTSTPKRLRTQKRALVKGKEVLAGTPKRPRIQKQSPIKDKELPEGISKQPIYNTQNEVDDTIESGDAKENNKKLKGNSPVKLLKDNVSKSRASKCVKELSQAKDSSIQNDIGLKKKATKTPNVSLEFKEPLPKKCTASLQSKESFPRKLRGSRKIVSEDSKELSVSKHPRVLKAKTKLHSPEIPEIPNDASQVSQIKVCSPDKNAASKKNSAVKSAPKILAEVKPSSPAETGVSQKISRVKSKAPEIKISQEKAEVSKKKSSEDKSKTSIMSSKAKDSTEIPPSESTETASNALKQSPKKRPTETKSQAKPNSSKKFNPAKKSPMITRKGRKKSMEAVAILNFLAKKDSKSPTAPTKTKISVDSKKSSAVKLVKTNSKAKENKNCLTPKTNLKKKPILRIVLKTKAKGRNIATKTKAQSGGKAPNAKSPKPTTKKVTEANPTPSKPKPTTKEDTKSSKSPKATVKKATKISKSKPTAKEVMKSSKSPKPTVKKATKISQSPSKSKTTSDKAPKTIQSPSKTKQIAKKVTKTSQSSSKSKPAAKKAPKMSESPTKLKPTAKKTMKTTQSAKKSPSKGKPTPTKVIKKPQAKTGPKKLTKLKPTPKKTTAKVGTKK